MVCCAPVQVAQAVHGALPLALKVVPATQALATQLLLVSV